MLILSTWSGLFIDDGGRETAFLFGSGSFPVVLFFPVAGPVGKRNAASSRFTLSHQAVHLSFFLPTFSFFANNQCFRRLFRRFDRSHLLPARSGGLWWLSRSFRFLRSTCRW